MIYSTYVHVQLPDHILLKYNFHLLKKNSEIELSLQGKTLGLYTDGWIERLIYKSPLM